MVDMTNKKELENKTAGIEQIKILTELFYDVKHDIDCHSFDYSNYDVDPLGIEKSIILELESKFSNSPEAAITIARTFAYNIDTHLMRSKILIVLESWSVNDEHLTFGQWVQASYIVTCAYSLLCRLKFFDPKMSFESEKDLEVIKDIIHKDGRKKRDTLSNYDIAYAINIVFGKVLTNIKKDEKVFLFNHITGRSGADIYNNLSGKKHLTKEKRDQIESELNDIKLRLNKLE